MKRPPTSGSWRPGQSGNPSGRPATDGFLRDLAREHTEVAWQTIIACLNSPDARVALRAAELVLDRGYGRPPVMAELKVEREPSYIELLRAAQETAERRRLQQAAQEPSPTALPTPPAGSN